MVVHGVGASEPGAMLRQLCGDLAGVITTRRIASESYPELTQPADARFQAAYEVYWGSLKPGGDSPLARVLRPLHVILALSRIGGAGWGQGRRGADAPSVFGELLHALLWCGMLTSPALYFPLLHAEVLPRPWGALAAVLFFAPGWLLALSLRRLDRWARLSVWLSPCVAFGAILAATQGWISLRGGARLTGQVVNATYALAVELSALALAEVAFKLLRASDRPPPICFFVRFATLTLPFTLLNGVLGSMAWAANLAVDNWLRPRALARWGEAYMATLPFDLSLLELAFAAATFTFVAVLVIAFLTYLAGLGAEARKASPKALGLQLRDRIAAAFVVLAVINTAVAALYGVNSLLYRAQNILRFEFLGIVRDLFLRLGDSLTGVAALAAAPSAFAIYAASSLRIVSFIPSLFRPLRRAAAVVADVVLWLAPGDQLGYRRRARARMNALLRTLAPDFDVQILAYSQGSVIAADALSNLPPGMAVDLLTAGSPHDSLYGRFLDMVVRRRPASAASWRNFYRLSDYVGGPVGAADDNIVVAQDYAMNHFNYFREPAIVRVVGRRGGVDPAPAAPGAPT